MNQQDLDRALYEMRMIARERSDRLEESSRDIIVECVRTIQTECRMYDFSMCEAARDVNNEAERIYELCALPY